MEFNANNIEEAVLVTLIATARETKRPKPRIEDEKAVQIVDALGLENDRKHDRFLAHESVVARTVMFDNAVKSLLLQCPDAVCINLGCGFDNRFPRVDNGQITWYDVDSADILAMRRNFFGPRNRVYLVQGDPASATWTKYVPKCRPVIAIAEHLFTRFDREQAKACLNALADSFPKGMLIAQLAHAGASKAKSGVRQADSDPWTAKDAHDLETLDSRFKLVREDSLASEMKRYTLRGKAVNMTARNRTDRLAIFSWSN